MAPPRHPHQRHRPQDSINAWVDNWNNDPKPFIWRKTADEILDSLATYIQRIPQNRTLVVSAEHDNVMLIRQTLNANECYTSDATPGRA